jgi:DNA polymerase-3 subunit alpha
MTKVYCERKNGIEEVPKTKINEIIDTYGVLIYQETLLKICKELAGFNSADSIKMMKSVGKKNAKLLFSLENKFLEGCKKVNLVNESDAKTLFDNIKKSARYAFNKCLCPSTLVNVNDKFISLEDVSIGDMVKTPSGVAKIVDKIENGIKEIYNVVLENGISIRCTIDHKFLCEDGSIKPLWEVIQNMDRIICDND